MRQAIGYAVTDGRVYDAGSCVRIHLAHLVASLVNTFTMLSRALIILNCVTLGIICVRCVDHATIMRMDVNWIATNSISVA
jgi:hypothetical protein